MFYLIWGLLSIGLFLFFILICFQGTKLIREKLGLLAALILCLDYYHLLEIQTLGMTTWNLAEIE